jgi:hypothetical protein
MRRFVCFALCLIALTALTACYDPSGDYYGDAVQPGQRYDVSR